MRSVAPGAFFRESAHAVRHPLSCHDPRTQPVDPGLARGRGVRRRKVHEVRALPSGRQGCKGRFIQGILRKRLRQFFRGSNFTRRFLFDRRAFGAGDAARSQIHRLKNTGTKFVRAFAHRVGVGKTNVPTVLRVGPRFHQPAVGVQQRGTVDETEDARILEAAQNKHVLAVGRVARLAPLPVPPSLLMITGAPSKK